MRRISLVLVLAAAACRHEAASPPSNQVAPARPSAAADALAFLPLDTEIVVGVDVAALRSSAVWAEYQSKLTERLGPQLTMVQKNCGFDPIQSVQSMTLGVLGKDAAGSVLIVRGLERDRTTACLKTKVIPDTAVTVDRDVVSLSHRGDTPDLLAFADRSTLVLQSSKQQTPDSLRALLQGGAPLRASPAFLEMFDRLERGATAWLVINGNASMFDKLAGMGTRPRAIYGTFRVASGISAQVHVRMPTPNEATQLAGMAKGQTQQAAAMFDRLDVTAEGDTVTVVIEMSLDKLRSMVSMMAMMAGASQPATPPTP